MLVVKQGWSRLRCKGYEGVTPGCFLTVSLGLQGELRLLRCFLSPASPTGVKGPPAPQPSTRRLTTASPDPDASPDLSLSTSSLSDARVTILFGLLSSCRPASGPQLPDSPGSGLRPRFLRPRLSLSRPGAFVGPEGGGGRRIRPGPPALPAEGTTSRAKPPPAVRHPLPCSQPRVAHL